VQWDRTPQGSLLNQDSRHYSRSTEVQSPSGDRLPEAEDQSFRQPSNQNHWLGPNTQSKVSAPSPDIPGWAGSIRHRRSNASENAEMQEPTHARPKHWKISWRLWHPTSHKIDTSGPIHKGICILHANQVAKADIPEFSHLNVTGILIRWGL
jgi:hypothetical protein